MADNNVITALIGAAAAVATVIATAIGQRWKTRSDAKAAESVNRVHDADADAKTSDALATAFQTITDSLTIIHDLRARLGTVEADLLQAQRQIVELQRERDGLIDDKTRLIAERDAALARLDLAVGDVRQLKQVLSSAGLQAPMLNTD